MTSAVTRFADALRRRGENIRDASDPRVVLGSTFDFDLTERRLGEVRSAFSGVRLDDRYEVVIEAVGTGSALRILQRCGSSVAPLRLPTPETVRAVLVSRLDLVRGIGPYRSATLRARGARTLADLVDTLRYPLYCDDASLILRELDAEDLMSLCDRLRRRFGGAGHLLASLLASVVDPQEIAFLDVETLGLDNNMIFLLGVGRFRTGGFVVEQFLAPTPSDEPAALALCISALEGVRILVTYNGRTADLPWLANRCFYHRVAPLPPLAHIDLLYGTRRRWKMDEELLPDARLPTVQELLLGSGRPLHDIPSSLIPDLYDAYTTSPDDEGLLVPVLDHNRSDIEALCSLLEMHCSEAAAVGESSAR